MGNCGFDLRLLRVMREAAGAGSTVYAAHTQCTRCAHSLHTLHTLTAHTLTAHTAHSLHTHCTHTHCTHTLSARTHIAHTLTACTCTQIRAGLEVLGWGREVWGAGVLTHVELGVLLLEGVGAPAGLVVLLQHQHPLACPGQRPRGRQPPHAAADDHGVQLCRHPAGAEPCTRACVSPRAARAARTDSAPESNGTDRRTACAGTHHASGPCHGRAGPSPAAGGAPGAARQRGCRLGTAAGGPPAPVPTCPGPPAAAA